MGDLFIYGLFLCHFVVWLVYILPNCTYGKQIAYICAVGDFVVDFPDVV